MLTALSLDIGPEAEVAPVVSCRRQAASGFERRKRLQLVLLSAFYLYLIMHAYLGIYVRTYFAGR